MSRGLGDVYKRQGLYDRALGASYLNGLWEAIQKNNIQRNGQNGAAAV